MAKAGAKAGPADGQSNAGIAPAQGHQLPQAGGAAEGLQPCQSYLGVSRSEAGEQPSGLRQQTRSACTPKPPLALGGGDEGRPRSTAKPGAAPAAPLQPLLMPGQPPCCCRPMAPPPGGLPSPPKWQTNSAITFQEEASALRVTFPPMLMFSQGLTRSPHQPRTAAAFPAPVLPATPLRPLWKAFPCPGWARAGRDKTPVETAKGPGDPCEEPSVPSPAALPARG